MIANLMVGLSKAPKGSVMLDEGILRHMILSQLLTIRKKYKNDYPEFVIAADMKNSWRRDEFPYYKYSRKKAREDLGIDWQLVIESLEKIRQEIHDYFPYRVIAVPRAEADDVIGVIAARFGNPDPSDWFAPTSKVLILSGDHDFIQLQRYPNVQQYDPIRKKELRTDDPEKFLFEHICTGDTGDGIPNILSPSDTFVTKTRQKPVRQVALDAWFDYVSSGTIVDEKHVKVLASSKDNFARNRKLIDLSATPQSIQTLINESFDAQKDKNKKQLMNYMIQHRLRTLTESISEY
jgi:5'-3' exonuclease